MKVIVYPGAFCDFQHMDDDGCMELEEGATLGDVYKKLKVPVALRVIGTLLVNYERAGIRKKLKEGDVISFFATLSGG